VELLEQDKPETVRNFLRYLEAGAYQGVFFHRLDPSFVIQGGGFSVVDLTTAPRLDAVPAFPPIVNEFERGRRFSNTFGTLAMARVGGQTNSATSQWFFNLKDNSFLDGVDGGFTVFGRTFSGTNVLDRFNTFSGTPPTNVIVDLRAAYGGAFGEMPVLSTNLTFGDILYVDISLLKLSVQRLADGTRQLSWPNVTGRVNHLEASSTWPAVWETVHSTNGTSELFQVIDSQANASARYYRVRLDSDQ
jgi:cyclophilin family peptidyl-prolyl cis-trans isomerase